MKHIELIQDDAFVIAYKVDTMAYRPVVMLNAKDPPEGFEVAFATNYSWKGEPIGILFDQDYRHKSIRKYEAERPCLEIMRNGSAWVEWANDVSAGSRVCVQAGPWLVQQRKVNIDNKTFKFDAIRRADHIAVGTKDGKLYAGYFRNATLEQMAEWFLKQQCYAAMKMDGGHAAYLETPDRRLGNQGTVPCGLAFVRRTK